MIPLTESIDIMFDKWFNDLKCGTINDETILSKIEYERVILNKICCIAEDLKFYKVLDNENYFSI